MSWFTANYADADKVFTITVTATAGCTLTQSVSYTLTIKSCYNAEIVVLEAPDHMYHIIGSEPLQYLYGNDNNITKFQTQIAGVPTTLCGGYQFTSDASWILVTTGGALTNEQSNLSVDTTDTSLMGVHYLNFHISLAQIPSVTSTTWFDVTIHVVQSDPLPDMYYSIGEGSKTYTKTYHQNLNPISNCHTWVRTLETSDGSAVPGFVSQNVDEITINTQNQLDAGIYSLRFRV